MSVCVCECSTHPHLETNKSHWNCTIMASWKIVIKKRNSFEIYVCVRFQRFLVIQSSQIKWMENVLLWCCFTRFSCRKKRKFVTLSERVWKWTRERERKPLNGNAYNTIIFHFNKVISRIHIKFGRFYYHFVWPLFLKGISANLLVV